MCVLENHFHLIPVRRFLSVLFLSVAVSTPAFCQDARIDSLENLLTEKQPDSLTAKILVELSSAYQYSNFTKAKQLAEEAVRLSEETGFKRTKARAYQHLGTMYTLS